MTARILVGDCRDIMAAQGPFDMIIADQPYGDTSLEWDQLVGGWLERAHASLKPTGSMWCFGSMRLFLAIRAAFAAAGWKYAQDIIWEKHNGSASANDRFRRVHEIAVQFYRADSPWEGVFNDVRYTNDATAKTARRKSRPPHWGSIENSVYRSEDGGPRLMRSVIAMRSMHGHAIHPTEKPVGLLEILIRTSCPPGGLVGDFFAGSGAAGEACLHAGRDYVGAELDPDMAAKAQARLDGNLFSKAA
jgi:site-specific DNA-methyltransferase (adenine-specific)